MAKCPNCAKEHNTAGLAGFQCSCGRYYVAKHDKWFDTYGAAARALRCQYDGPTHYSVGPFNTEKLAVNGCLFFAEPGSTLCAYHNQVTRVLRKQQ